MEQPPSTEQTGPQKGDVIEGKLEIDGIIAEGRTSTVVSAIDRSSGERIAVKIARGSDLESVERFKRAARGMQRLTSPYVVRVLGVGTTPDGAPCMSMELLEGRTLAQKIMQSGPLPIEEATKWMLQACDALADAHAHKLLHRDLDAESLFLAMPRLGSGGQPSVRVLDFGLAPVWRLGKGDGRLRPGDVPGTSFAMAPELARGSDLDERVDVWGVGACLYRLLTNRHPYSARNLAELCTRILAERPPDVSKVRPDVTPGLAAVVKRCLEREPADRYATIRDVIDALEATKDEAPLTPQVPTERATLEELRAIEEARARMTSRGTHGDAEAERVTDPGPSREEDDQDATQIHHRPDAAMRSALATVVEPDPDFATTTVLKDPPRFALPKVEPPKHASSPKRVSPPKHASPFAESEEPAGDLGAPPQTTRIAPSFEAIANRLELPKPKRSDPPKRSDAPKRSDPPKRSDAPRRGSGLPPPLPPPLHPFAASAGVEEVPSTQPLGRLSPFAELPKAPPPPESVPSSDDRTIKPVLIGGPPPPAPLPKPSPAMMSAETIAPPPAPSPEPTGMSAKSGSEPPTGILPMPVVAGFASADVPAGLTTAPLTTAPLPRPSPAMMAAETIQGSAPAGPEPPAHPSPLVFQASPRVLELPPTPTPTGPPPIGAPPALGSAPAPLPSDRSASHAALASDRSASHAALPSDRSAAPPLASGPPSPFASGSGPFASGSPAPFASGSPAPLVGGPPREAVASASEGAPAKSRLLVPLIFALGIAIAAVGGLYVARRTTLPTDASKPSASSSAGETSSAPSSEPSSAVGAASSAPPTPSPPTPSPPESETAATPEPESPESPASPDGPSPSATPSVTSATTATTPPRRHRRPPPPAPAPSPAPAPAAPPAPAKSGNIYDPSTYDLK